MWLFVKFFNLEIKLKLLRDEFSLISFSKRCVGDKSSTELDKRDGNENVLINKLRALSSNQEINMLISKGSCKAVSWFLIAIHATIFFWLYRIRDCLKHSIDIKAAIIHANFSAQYNDDSGNIA